VKRWLVTGAGGFFGANAGAFLNDRAHAVGAYRRLPSASSFHRAIGLDLTSESSIHEAVTATRPDVILHAAAMASHESCETDPALARLVNVDATAYLARASAEVGATFVYLSTDAVFDGTRGSYTERDTTNPFSVYGETKLLGEGAALAAHDDVVVARTNFFGWSPTGTRSILEFFVNALRSGQQVPGYTDFVVSSIYVQDLLTAIYDLVDSDRRGVIHLGAANALSKYEFGVQVASQFGLDAELISPVAAAAGGHATSRARDLSLDTSLLESLLGWTVPTQEVGLASAYDDESTLASRVKGLKE
jgi:dTDP-4-dehydrorhamnose reductase